MRGLRLRRCQRMKFAWNCSISTAVRGRAPAKFQPVTIGRQDVASSQPMRRRQREPTFQLRKSFPSPRDRRRRPLPERLGGCRATPWDSIGFAPPSCPSPHRPRRLLRRRPGRSRTTQAELSLAVIEPQTLPSGSEFGWSLSPNDADVGSGAAGRSALPVRDPLGEISLRDQGNHSPAGRGWLKRQTREPGKRRMRTSP